MIYQFFKKRLSLPQGQRCRIILQGSDAVKYTVNWVEKNLGVTRKTLRIYEEKGLMDKTTFQNPDNRYREYSDQDIERIWFYRLLQGIGYSLNEIVEMIQTADFDFYASISAKNY